MPGNNGNHKIRILVLDDEKPIRRFLRASLASHQFDVSEARNAEEGLLGVISFRPDVLILDLGLPDLDGIEVVRRIRTNSRLPIIILSVRDDETGKIESLDAGADDYLTKPFNEGELLARIRAVLRRLSPASSDPVFKVGALSVDLSRREVCLQDHPVELTPTEFDLLKLFISNAGKVVTRKEIYREMWNKTENYDGVAHLLRVTVSNLRNKIELHSERPSFILTEPGVGYRLDLR